MILIVYSVFLSAKSKLFLKIHSALLPLEKYSSFLAKEYKEKDSCETQNSKEKYNLLINIDISVDVSQVTKRTISYIEIYRKMGSCDTNSAWLDNVLNRLSYAGSRES